MAIEKEYGKFIPVCDGCTTTLDECDTFQDALDECKENGWTNVKVGYVWENRCPKCGANHKQKSNGPRFLDW